MCGGINCFLIVDTGPWWAEATVQNHNHHKKCIIRIKQPQPKISVVSLAKQNETLNFGVVRKFCFCENTSKKWGIDTIF